MIHSINSMLPEQGLISNRSFRDPHHAASMASLIGGGQKSKPGEVSLDHNGVLFLDELPEFQRSPLDSLRQPLETGETSAQIRTRVKNVRAQRSFKHKKQAQLNAKLLADFDFELTDETNELLHKYIDKFALMARGFHKI